MISFINAEKAKLFAQSVSYDMSIYKKRLAQLIEENAKQGNTAVFTVLPKHLVLSEIHRLSSDLNQLGYSIRFEVKEFYYSFNIHWN
ncbi:hypothetical protein SKM54_07760 [Acinetobacter faecalis]|uniref:hypothetical protein n=1 Tax=Acinetobacter faecalis TaxID=2665161 RepID=UPI002A908E11|nr:hypothetical protein [Acinetobacter faecalis]MDY6467015.1 hypothetical protein [Acinetobacter faecalis]MDY6482336.1 hypothetical protein [Acinetobacter faecalis]